RHNQAIAEGLLRAQASLGSWRGHFHHSARLEGVGAADVQRVLKERFTPTNSSVVILRPGSDTPARSAEEDR
ncbi:MAG: hypothetical protein MK291_08300, partial [Planctomycetes bacterium]|nr:hypothetical protein [Planctomycetota bacterium]